MRVSKLYSALLIAFLAIGFVACNNTVSSTDASEISGINNIPGYNPGKADSTKTKDISSSSETPTSDAGSSAVEESSASEEESSSSEEISSSSIDFSGSNIQVDESGIAIITSEYLESVSSSVASDLDEKWDLLENQGESPEKFTGSKTTDFSVDDLNFAQSHYYCFTEAQEWFEITKEKLLETKLPFLWDGIAYDAREGFALSFGNVCDAIYLYGI